MRNIGFGKGKFWVLMSRFPPGRCCGQDGYVDGVDAGEEASLQVGFKLGFREGAAQTAAVGRLKGIVR